MKEVGPFNTSRDKHMVRLAVLMSAFERQECPGSGGVLREY